MSKRKGAKGEREAAAKLNEVLGTQFHRGRQYHGGPESPDLAGDVPGLHVEVKRTERLRIWEAVRQARADGGVDQVPVVMHRANKKPWVLIVEAEMLIRLLDVVDEARGKLVDSPASEGARLRAAEDGGTTPRHVARSYGGAT
ncbi:MAG: hypothetical protein HQ548_05270 [Chloroflexi bacterium]|nr:hypothetical protein [Chloroflexota bacterium]